MLRYFLCLLGILFALPVLVLIVLAFTLPISLSGIGYLLACALAISGLIITPWRGKYSFILISTGMILIALIAGTRLVLAQREVSSNLRMLILPHGKNSLWVSYLIDEQDAIILGETIFHSIGGDSPTEHENLDSALAAAYAELRGVHGVFPSPVVSTYLNLQRPSAFDAVLIEPKINRHPQMAVIFLHGYMGNVTAQCWEIAQAVDRFGAITVCPSTDWTGQWWQPEGKAILASTFAYLRAQGIQKFYLGGFSNGGFGISRLVSKLSEEDGLSGLIFIDGIYDGVSIKETGLPVLIIQGTQDERVPATEVQQIADVIGESATYVEVDSDHFLIMKQPEFVQNAIAAWLEKQAADK